MERRAVESDRRDATGGSFRSNLPRIDVVIDIESHICPCCGERLHKIGETVKEAFDVVPMQHRSSALCVRGMAAGDAARV